MKILCLSINALQNFPGLPKWKQSLAFSYLRAYYSTSKYYSETEFIDLVYYENVNPDDVIAHINEQKADILACSAYLWNIEKILHITNEVRKYNKDIKIILGGPEFTYNSTNTFMDSPAVDTVVVGEGEETFKEVLDSYHEDNDDLRAIKGIIFKDNSGHIICNERRPSIEDLDTIPSPYLLGLFDVTKIENSLVELETQRGCSFDCGYCNYPKGKGSKGIRFFGMERVEKELELILSHKPKQLFLMDPTFNINKKRAKAILTCIIKYNKGTTINTEMMPDILNEEIILLSREAGMKIIEIGIQSFTPKAVEVMGRFRNEEKLLHNIEFASQEGIYLMPQIIMGLPGDDLKSFFNTFDRTYDFKSDEIEINYLSLLPQTKYRSNAEKYGIKYNKRAPYGIIESDDFSKEDINLLKKFRKVVLVTLPLKRTINKVKEIKQFDYHKIFLDFLAEQNNNLKDFVWPIQTVEDKDNAIETIDHFCDFFVNRIGDVLDEELEKDVEQCKRHGQISLAAHMMSL